jgi:hypothetical protein
LRAGFLAACTALALLAGAMTARAQHSRPGVAEVPAMSEIEAVRGEYVEYWQALGSAGVDGLERFARTVQMVVDTRAGQHGTEDRAVRMVLDDLVDLFVSETYRREKDLVMSTPAVLGHASVREREGDLTGFAPRFQAGEGRFRHFALNAAAALAAPDALVDLAARLRGRDLLAASSDSLADLATNRIGRDFARFLRERPLLDLADGSAVRAWVVDRFGE